MTENCGPGPVIIYVEGVGGGGGGREKYVRRIKISVRPPCRPCK